MPSAQVEPPSESKLKQAAEALGDAVIGQVFEGVIDGAAKVMSGAVDAISGVGELAADCGSAAVEAACQAAGSVLDGL